MVTIKGLDPPDSSDELGISVINKSIKFRFKEYQH
jgi:hypothetical protein